MKRLLSLLTFAFLVGQAHAAEVKERTFEVTYKATVKDIPKDAREVNLWLPVPQDNHVQKISDVRVSAPAKYRITKDAEYGNRILFVKVKEPKTDTVTVELKFKATRQEIVNRPAIAAARTGGPTDPMLNRFLQPDKLIPINERIRNLSDEIAGNAPDPTAKAKLIYDYVLANVKYDKTGQGWGRGDILYVCDEKRGNCTDFHALAIGLARAQRIPAKFEIGLSIPTAAPEGKIAGYHCWAYLFLDQFGWVPIDASEAWKYPDKRDYFYGALDEHRVAFSVGRDVPLMPAPKEQPRVNFFIYPYAEVDGKTHTAVDKEFAYRDMK